MLVIRAGKKFKPTTLPCTTQNDARSFSSELISIRKRHTQAQKARHAFQKYQTLRQKNGLRAYQSPLGSLAFASKRPYRNENVPAVLTYSVTSLPASRGWGGERLGYWHAFRSNAVTNGCSNQCFCGPCAKWGGREKNTTQNGQHVNEAVVHDSSSKPTTSKHTRHREFLLPRRTLHHHPEQRPRTSRTRTYTLRIKASLHSAYARQRSAQLSPSHAGSGRAATALKALAPQPPCRA